MTTETIFAGFGGQGILFAGKLLAYLGLYQDKQVSCCLPTALKCAAAPLTAPSA